MHTQTLAHYQYPQHAAYVFKHTDSGRIHCVKYNSAHLTWEYFDADQWHHCTEYMIESMPTGIWGFSAGESE